MEEKTFVVLGIPRGGTSMIGGILRLLGIHMGDIINGPYGDKHEDQEFYKSKTYDQRRALIIKRNKQHTEWGFKDPSVVRYIDELHKLRNPHFIIITRDLTAAADSYVDRTTGKKFDFAVKRFCNWQNQIQSFYLNNLNKYKFLHISYEKILLNKKDNLKKIIKFCGKNLKESDTTIDELMAFVSPGYKGLNDERGEWKNIFHSKYFDGDKTEEQLKLTVRPKEAWENIERDADNHLQLLEINKQPGKVFEIGVGCGRLLKKLKQDYKKTVAGVDASEKMVYLAYKELAGSVIARCKGDGSFKAMQEYYDTVISMLTFQHIPNIGVIKRYIDNSYKILKVGGELKFQLLGKEYENSENPLWAYHCPDLLKNYMDHIGFKGIQIKHYKKWIVMSGVK